MNMGVYAKLLINVLMKLKMKNFYKDEYKNKIKPF